MPDPDLATMAEQISAVPGVVGVLLGGSRARGDARPDSDDDLGIYYAGAPDLSALNALAARWSQTPVEIAAPGSWGPWVNTGGWLTVDDRAVDWILRDLDRVHHQCDRARRGEFAFHPQAGHPLGFLDVAYAGELASAVILADPSDRLRRMQQSLTPYPPALRDAMVEGLWEAGFLVDAARKGARRADPAYVGLCLVRALMLCAHALHADIGRWVTNEKGLVPAATQLPNTSARFAEASARLGALGDQPESLTAAADLVGSAVADTVERLSNRR